MSRAIYGAPAEALRQALDALARLAFWISWTADPDLRPDIPVSTRNMREAAAALRKAADVLDLAADRAAEPGPPTGPKPWTRHPARATPPTPGRSPADTSGDGRRRSVIAARGLREPRPEAESNRVRAGTGRPERAGPATPVPSFSSRYRGRFA